MAIQHDPYFAGISGHINRQLLFRQRGGKTVVSSFPDRSSVVYSEKQRQAQKTFAEAVSFARVVIREPGLRRLYQRKALLLGFRSAWNAAIAEYMSEKPLVKKLKKKILTKGLLVGLEQDGISSRLYRSTAPTGPMLVQNKRIYSLIRAQNPDVESNWKLLLPPNEQQPILRLLAIKNPLQG